MSNFYYFDRTRTVIYGNILCIEDSGDNNETIIQQLNKKLKEYGNNLKAIKYSNNSSNNIEIIIGAIINNLYLNGNLLVMEHNYSKEQSIENLNKFLKKQKLYNKDIKTKLYIINEKYINENSNNYSIETNIITQKEFIYS